MQRCRLLNLLTGWRLCGCRHAEQSAGNDWLSAGRPQCGPLLSTFRLERSPKWPPSAETAASHSRSVDIAVSIRQIPCETYRPAPISVLVPPEWHQKGGKEEAPPPRQPFVGNGVASLHTASLCQQEAHPGRPQAVPSATKELRVVAAAAHSMN